MIEFIKHFCYLKIYLLMFFNYYVLFFINDFFLFIKTILVMKKFKFILVYLIN